MHIDKNWRRGLREHVRSQEDIAEVYTALKTLQLEGNKAAFRKLLQDFCAWCETNYPRFHGYFTDTYVKHPEQWAACFRAGAGCNTNMYTEAFHNILKGLYFQRKQNRMIDHLLCHLLKIARDKIFEGLIEAQKGKRTYRQKESERRHKSSQEMNEISEIDLTSWKVKSQQNDTDFYKVSLANEEFDCYIKCSKCHVCHHMFQCQCMDFIIRGIACKHIHAVQTLRFASKGNEQNKINEKNATEDIKYFEGFLGATDNRRGCKSDSNHVRISIINRISTLVDIVKASLSATGLRTVMAHVNSTTTVAEGLNKLEYEHSYDLKPKHNYPPNKKLDLQEIFISTKRKKVRPKARLQHPTMEERKKVKAMLEEETPNICAFCFEEDDATSKETSAWVECPLCGLWAHWACDRNEEDSIDDYICSVCLSA